jgi:NAD(P)-dependent dehydrogenase (short-subunit alcohol dehydrogenase family)
VSAAAAEKVAADIRGAHGTAHAVACDVSAASDAERTCAVAVREYGGLHILVNSAAVLAGDGPVTALDIDAWQRSLDVNVTGVLLMTKYAVPLIAASGGGSIIQIGSVLGHVGSAGRTAYCAQKGAVLQMTKAMAIDHGPANIRVNSISPGPIATERYMRKFGLKTPQDSPRANDTVLGRIGEPREVAAAAVFLASDASSFTTGADLLVDGGICAQ